MQHERLHTMSIIDPLTLYTADNSEYLNRGSGVLIPKQAAQNY
jgi:hypothetical protein